MHKREGVAELMIKIQQLRSTVGCLVGCLQVVRQYKPTGECGIDIVGNPFARIQPKIRVRDFFWGGFCRNPGRGEILAFAAAMPGGFAGGTRPERAEERNRGERSMTVRNAPGRSRFFCRARDAFFFAFPAAAAPGPSPGSCRWRRTASRFDPWHGARSCPPCSRAAGERSRCASTRSSRPARGASVRTG